MAGWNWQLPIVVSAGSGLLLCLFFLIGPDVDLLYLFVLTPLVLLACVVLLIRFAVRKDGRRSLSALLTVVAFVAISWTLLSNEAKIRPWLRWQLLSGHFKTKVLSETTPANNELRHVEWDGWGGAAVGDWTAYVVFDPNDSLLPAAENHLSGKFTGIPCDVDQVQRLESQWYSVTFSVNEWWRPGC